MSDVEQKLLFGAIGFYSVALGTWLSASHRKLFIRFFVPRHELKQAMRGGFRKKDEVALRRSMRQMAGLQAALATIILAVAIYYIAVSRQWL